MQVSAIIPAAGHGRRMGGVKKPYLALGGRPILAYTLMVFQKCPRVDKILVVVAEGDEKSCIRDIIAPYGIEKAQQVLIGGATRQESVFNGLQSLTADTDMVVIHDAARPFVTEDMIDRTLDAAGEWGAAIVAVPMKDTIKEGDNDDLVVRTLDRKRLWAIQTPQTFRRDLILQAHMYAREKNIQATDDASLIEELGSHRVKLVMGSYENIKITTPDDLAVARAILQSGGEDWVK